MLDEFTEEEIKRIRKICPECLRSLEVVDEMIDELNFKIKEEKNYSILKNSLNAGLIVGVGYMLYKCFY